MGNITKEPSYCGHKAYGIPLILQGVGNFSALLEQLDVNSFGNGAAGHFLMGGTNNEIAE